MQKQIYDYIHKIPDISQILFCGPNEIDLLCIALFLDQWYNEISDITNKISQSQGPCCNKFPLYKHTCRHKLSIHPKFVHICTSILMHTHTHTHTHTHIHTHTHTHTPHAHPHTQTHIQHILFLFFSNFLFNSIDLKHVIQYINSNTKRTFLWNVQH